MKISHLIDAAARAAVEHEPVPATNPAPKTRLRYALHDAKETLADLGIEDDRMAAAVSLAKLETRKEAGNATPAIHREITLLTEFLNV